DDVATTAHGLRLLDLHEGRPGVPDREEQLGVLGQTRSAVAPIHQVSISVTAAFGPGMRAQVCQGKGQGGLGQLPTSLTSLAPYHKRVSGPNRAQGLSSWSHQASDPRSTGLRVTGDVQSNVLGPLG